MNKLNIITGFVLFAVSVSLFYLTAIIPQLESQRFLRTNAPERQDQVSNPSPLEVKHVKIRSGPYSVPSMNMLENLPDFDVAKPCTEFCTILKQWAGLEYPDGTDANVDSGMWLV
jgi:hypothetical protein